MIFKINKKSRFKEYLSNTFYLFFEKIFLLVLALFVSVYVARYLGPANFGKWNYALSFVNLLIALNTLGLNNTIVKELVNVRFAENQILGSSFYIQIISCIISFILVVVWSILFESDPLIRSVLIIVGLALFFKPFIVLEFYFQSVVKSKYSVIAHSLSYLVSSIFKVVLVSLGLTLIYFSFDLFIEYLLLAVIMIFYFTKSGNSIRNWKYDRPVIRELLITSWPLLLTTFSGQIFMKIDQIMLQKMANSYEVGIYAAASRISNIWTFVPIVISRSLFPSILKSKKVSNELYDRRIQGMYDLLTFLGLTVAIFFTFSSNFIIDLLYGVKYQKAGNILGLHIWFCVFNFFVVANSKWVVTEGFQKKGMMIQIFGAVSNIIFNLILIPYYAALGAAIATLASAILMALFVPLVLGKEFRHHAIMFIKSFILFKSYNRILVIIKEYIKFK